MAWGQILGFSYNTLALLSLTVPLISDHKTCCYQLHPTSDMKITRNTVYIDSLNFYPLSQYILKTAHFTYIFVLPTHLHSSNVTGHH